MSADSSEVVDSWKASLLRAGVYPEQDAGSDAPADVRTVKFLECYQKLGTTNFFRVFLCNKANELVFKKIDCGTDCYLLCAVLLFSVRYINSQIYFY